MVVLLEGILATGVFLFRSVSAAHAQTAARVFAQSGATPRLELFEIDGGTVYHKWSDDNGATWTSWFALDAAPDGSNFVGTPTVVSDLPGRLLVIARTNVGTLWADANSNGQWSGWQASPGPGQGGTISICQNTTCSNYLVTSDPVIASGGGGYSDLFVFGHNTSLNGPTVLLHFNMDNCSFGCGYPSWPGFWETLGSSGSFQGNPAVVSWNVTRVDVFARGGGNELEHMWRDLNDGTPAFWHDWENLGGNLTSSPSAASGGQTGYLAVAGRNADNGLSFIQFNNGAWSSWADIDSNSMSSAPAVAVTPTYIHVFALDPSGLPVYRNWVNPSGWSAWVDLNGDGPVPYAPAAATWMPPPPPPPATPIPPTAAPRPTATPPPRRCLQPPCHVTP